ncbi:hypothetical protein LTS18_003565, partial [Coniosporium uncinatum]
MLVHLIHELVISRIDQSSTSPNKRAVEDFIESVRQHDLKVVWAYEDYPGKEAEHSGTRVPKAMTYVADEVVKIFTIAYPTFKEEWGRTALIWATTCPVRHLACRSFQVFRSILSTLDSRMLADMLARLSNTIADDQSTMETFSMEILMTLRSIIDALAPGDLVQYPQLFWTTCACLGTTHEGEFTESLAMLDTWLDKLDLGDENTINRLKESFPPKWEGPFEGLSSLIYKGIRSSTCLDRSLDLLQRLIILPSNFLVGDDSRLLFTILGNLPRFLYHFDPVTRGSNITAAAEALGSVAEIQGNNDLARTLMGFASNRYRAASDFLAQVIAAIRSSFFPIMEYRSLVFLMGLLSNKIGWFKIKAMQALCVLIPDIDMRQPEIASKGPDLISPLLRLLQTEYCPQALEVLDNVITMTGTPMDKHHLRMSMAGSHSSRAFRKEYERTQSLYGIPEESGWSIPMPAVFALTTRNNVHAVFYTCATAETMETLPSANQDIELVGEDYQNGGYVPDYRTATMMSDETRAEGFSAESMKLDDLDDFFDDDTTENSAIMPPPSSSTKFLGSPLDGRETVYDQQTAPILNKSLTRNASVSSFQTGFADMKVPSRAETIMTPTAFAIPNTSFPTALRPGMHSRSITSPAVNQRTPPGTGTSIALPFDEAEETFSDDDYSNPVSRTNTSETPVSAYEKSFSLEQMMKPLAQGTRSGFRQGFRRLTGGG